MSTAHFDEHGCFFGHEPRECGEHRTVGSHRAWCFQDGEWCYPTSACRGCELAALRPATPAPVLPGYNAVHSWVRRWRGQPSEHLCLDCGAPGAEWAFDNLEPSWTGRSGKYYPDIGRYFPLCVTCHRRRDHDTETCANGHRWADGNRYVRKDGKGTICRACRREGMRRRR